MKINMRDKRSCDIWSFSGSHLSVCLSAFCSACALLIAQVRSYFWENVPSNPSQCVCAHVCLCICIRAYKFMNIHYMPELAWKTFNVFLVSPEKFGAAVSFAVGCFKLRSKSNKPGLTYASILYKLSIGWPSTVTLLLPPCVCVFL